MLCLSGCTHFFVMQPNVLGLRHNTQIAGVVVVFVAVNVVHDFISLQWPAKHLFGNYAMLMPAVQLAISARLHLDNARQHCRSVICSALRLRRDVVRIAIATNALSVHSAHSASTFADVVRTSMNAALLWHGL
jgi:hypothetical protein